MNYNKRQRGFSLVEMLIVLAIMGVLALILVPTFGTWLEKQRLDMNAQEIGTSFSKARLLASSRGQVARVSLEADRFWIQVRRILPDGSIVYEDPERGSQNTSGLSSSALMSGIDFVRPSDLVIGNKIEYYFQPNGMVFDNVGSVIESPQTIGIKAYSSGEERDIQLSSIGLVNIVEP